MDGDARGVRGDQGARLAELLDFIEDDPFDVEPFDDDLDDPVALTDAGEVVIEISGGDSLGGVLHIERGGVALDRSLEGIIDQSVAGRLILALRGFLRDHVQQQHLQSDAGEMASDAGTHHAASQDGHIANRSFHIDVFSGSGVVSSTPVGLLSI